MAGLTIDQWENLSYVIENLVGWHCENWLGADQSRCTYMENTKYLEHYCDDLKSENPVGHFCSRLPGKLGPPDARAHLFLASVAPLGAWYVPCLKQKTLGSMGQGCRCEGPGPD